uniref:RNA helicase n=1 Tax=Fagus sylvatica TaxID=28930 RepID=A0A2N9FSE1_FAGSY
MANLPILQFEEQIIETVDRNPVVVIIGETGSGKSTQLSQMLHRRGYTKSGLIGVTQPRRVAAVSVARRSFWLWHDCWCGDLALKDAFPDLFECASHKDTFLNEVMVRQNGIVIWNVTFMRNFNDWEMDSIVEFLNLIESKAPVREVEDGSWWHLRKNGRFDIRSFYEALCDSPHVTFPWKSIWCTKAPRRVHFFVWSAAWNKILTCDNLTKRGYTLICSLVGGMVLDTTLQIRVAQELGVHLGDEVGYAIRFEDRTSERTRIKYLTDGVLLRESLSDPELSQYSVIVLDEAHERSLNTDILLGLMKRLVKMRASNLKVLITSATLDGEKVSKFFSNCPILTVPGKLYPVEILYSNERPTSYLESSLKKALDIHMREPEGDVLIFMTGQDDIEKLVSKLEDRVRSLEEGSCMDAVILPLHGSLPPELQAGSFIFVRVFSPSPPNCRRFIVATNIAETSLTVDGVVYVIDSGYVKQRQYNPSTGMYSLDVVQISKVQANQRAGRAGRTRPGKCYRLYPSILYHDDFLDVTVPEIQRSSLAGSVLYLKSLDLSDMDILKFDFLDPPSSESLQDALKQLYLIDAIDENGSITSFGRVMAELPLEPSLSRTLMEANECGCLFQALTVAAMLSAETTLLPGRSKSTEKKRKHTHLELPDGSGWGDHIQLLQIFEQWDITNYDIGWCKDHNLQVRGMLFVKDVRKQLSQIMQKIAKGSLDVRANGRWKESEQDYRNLRKALCIGYANQLAERMVHHNGYRTLGFKPQVVQVHPSSVLRPDDEGKLPDYVVYHELIATSRPYLRNVCAVEIHWVMPILNKVKKINVNKLSGGTDHIVQGTEGEPLDLPKKEVNIAGAPDDHESRVQAARERFLARKANK